MQLLVCVNIDIGRIWVKGNPVLCLLQTMQLESILKRLRIQMFEIFGGARFSTKQQQVLCCCCPHLLVY